MTTVVNPVEAELCSAAGRRRQARTTQLLAAAARAEGDGRGILLAEVVELNMCVADALVPPYLGRGVAIEELRRVVFLGLVEAVDRFDSAGSEADFRITATALIVEKLRVRVCDADAIVRPQMGTASPCRQDRQLEGSA